MIKKLTLENFIERAKITHNNFYTYNKSVYTTARKHLIVTCPLHGDFNQVPDSHLRGNGCKECGTKRRASKRSQSFEESISKAKKVHNNYYSYDKISEYTIQDKEYTITCPEHGDFVQNFSYHLSGRGCMKCGNERTIKSQVLDPYLAYERMIKAHNGKYTYPNFNYINCKDKLEISCPKHGSFFQAFSNHAKGVGCPSCVGVDSKAEIELRDFLKDYIHIEHSNRTILKNRAELDIFIKDKNLAIEYNGLYYHSDKFQENDYHLNKTKQCLNNNIQLVHVFQDEWEDKKDIVKSRLLSLIGKSENRVYARKTIIKEVETAVAMDFLDKNHIQGKAGSKYKLGLYYNEELVSLMTFGELRKNIGYDKKEGSFELIRFCNKLNTNVIGGASKLLKYFEIKYNPEEILSYADMRWSQGDLYEKLDFKLSHQTKPNYFYTRGKDRENRFKYRKDILIKEGFDKDKSEKQIMSERGYNRIYDCGSLKYIKTKTKKE